MLIFAGRRIARAVAAHHRQGQAQGQGYDQSQQYPQYQQQQSSNSISTSSNAGSPPPYSPSPAQNYGQSSSVPQAYAAAPTSAQPLISYGNMMTGPSQLIGLDPHFCFNQPLMLLIDEHWSLTTPDFTVTTMQGQPVVHCNGRGKRMDFHIPSQGFPALTLTSDTFTIGAANFHLRAGNVDAEIKGRFTLLHGQSTSFDVKFDNMVGGGGEVRLESRGEFGGGHGAFVIVARDVGRHKSDLIVANGRTLGAQYEVDVVAGMDVAVVVAMVVCMNARRAVA